VPLQVSSDHGGATYSVSLTDAGVRGGDVLDGLRLGVKSGGLEAIYEPNNGNHLIRTNHTLSVSMSQIQLTTPITCSRHLKPGQHECRGPRGGTFRAIWGLLRRGRAPESPQLSDAAVPPAAMQGRRLTTPLPASCLPPPPAGARQGRQR
jgi:hypothetical protein